MATNDGGPAFPGFTWVPLVDQAEVIGKGRKEQPGMTLRDYFAAAALATVEMGSSLEDTVEWCYAVADAMLKARNADRGGAA